MADDAFNEETGMIDVYKLLPEQGDSVMVVNCGDHFEIRHHHFGPEPLLLTDQDIELLKRGHITWN